MEFYGLFLKSYNIGVVEAGLTDVTFEMQSLTALTEPQLETLSRDISLLNAIRSNNDPAVKDQFEQLLTTIALTNHRNVPEVRDSMATTNETPSK